MLTNVAIKHWLIKHAMNVEEEHERVTKKNI